MATRKNETLAVSAKIAPQQPAEPTLYEQRLRETVEDIVVMLEFIRQRGMVIPPDVAASITELLRRPELGGPGGATPTERPGEIDLEDLAAAQAST